MANAGFLNRRLKFRIVLFTYGVHKIDHQYRPFDVGLLKVKFHLTLSKFRQDSGNLLAYIMQDLKYCLRSRTWRMLHRVDW